MRALPAGRSRVRSRMGRARELVEDVVDGSSDAPLGEWRPQLREVGVVTDMVADARLVAVCGLDANVKQRLYALQRLQDRDAVLLASTDVVDLTGPGRLDERFECPHHVVAVNLI